MVTKIKKISKSEQKYRAMSRAERRVAIARDVIAAINAGKFGGIVSGYYIKNFDNEVLNQKTARENMASCSVCARGAMLVSKVAKYSNFKCEAVDYILHPPTFTQDQTTLGLRDAFSESQLDLIETAFEGGDMSPSGMDDEVAGVAAKYFEDHPEPKERLIAICQNIIDHGGTFKPRVRYDVYYK